MAEVTVVAILLMLAAAWIGLIYAIKHRDTVFAGKRVPDPPPRLPWTRPDVFLHVCAALCLACPLFGSEIPGLAPLVHQHTLAGAVSYLALCLPWIVLNIVIGLRDRRRRKALQEGRDLAPGEGANDSLR